MTQKRITHQPGFVLHSIPYRETSAIVEVWTRDHGRVSLVAKGAKRPLSALRGVLQTFQPLSLSWSGQSALRTLIAAEWVGGLLPLEKSALLCGFYLNELMLKLTAREDPHPSLFQHYVTALGQLTHLQNAPVILRQFEYALLKALGVLDVTRSHYPAQAIHPKAWYVVDPQCGVRLIVDEAHNPPAKMWPRVLGQTLLDMENQCYTDATTLSQSKILMRFLLAHQLGNATLNTRQMLIDLRQLE